MNYFWHKSEIKTISSFFVLLPIIFFLFFLSSPVGAKENLFIYTRPGCPHCEDAKIFLKEFGKKYPDITVHYYDIWEDPSRMEELQAYAKDKGVSQIAVPFFRGEKGYLIGYLPGEEMEKKLLGLLRDDHQITSISLIHLPLIGQIDVRDYHIFALTALIGLLDGLNPCAMWVLLILLSLLIHLKKRSRIFLISGVFVIVSGVIYFLFMSSWLLFYDYIGISRNIQLIVGSVAFFIGLINIKDFFYLGKGITFSIPNKFKIKIAQKSAAIVKADSVWMALLSAATLAIFVNFVELLCTAGLPAIYTQIISQNKIIGAQRVLYLFIYTVFYMLDDAIMVFLAAWTLSQTRLQEKAGRMLKLVSGIVLLALSVMMVFFPNSLDFF